MTTPATQSYRNPWTGPLGDFRMMVSLRPEFLYTEARELALLYCCSETEAEEARRWVAHDGLEAAT